MPWSLRARVVYPVDAPPLQHGVVTVDGERIVGVGTKAIGKTEDLGAVALLPGLVNAHTHLEFSLLREPLGSRGMRLSEWIRLVIAERQRTTSPTAAIAAGANESVRRGVTTLGEIATANAASYSNLPAIDWTLFGEVIGFSRARAVSALAAATDRLDAYGQLATARAAGSTTGHMQVGISPHAPYSVSPELLRALIAAAQRQSLPVAMHVAESEEELQLLDGGTGRLRDLLEERSMWDEEAIPRGSRPLDYLRLLADAPRALVVHGNYLNGEELAFLAARAERMSLVYCPRTHAYFDHSPYPLAELLAAGVRVALGTDSRASNPDVCLLAEMRQVVREHPQVSPESVLRMATLAGAQALGRSREVGSLTPGKFAHLVAVPLPRSAGNEPEDLLASLLSSDVAPSAVWLAGYKVDSPSDSADG